MKNLYILIAFLFISFFADSQIAVSTVLNTANSYRNHTWTATSSNVWNRSCGNKVVRSVFWATPGTHTSVPYCWGGNSTLTQFNNLMANNKSAGDRRTDYGYGAEPTCSGGVDCSGFVSRCYGLNTHYSTTMLNTNSLFGHRSSYNTLLVGDFVNRPGNHTRLVKQKNNNGTLLLIESGSGVGNAGGNGLWKVFQWTYNVSSLINTSYNPQYYKSIGGSTPCAAPANDNCSSATTISSNGAILSGTVKCATSSYGPNQCSGCSCTSQDDNDVYYKFVAQATSHTVTLSNYSSNFDGVVELRTACAMNTSLGCYDPSGTPSTVVKTYSGLTVGSTYYVRIYTWNNSTSPPSSPTFKVKVTHTCNSPSSISAASYTGAETACTGNSKVYTVLPVTGATSYTWTLPSGWTGTSTTNSITTTVGASSGQVKVKANNTCGSSNLATKQVTVNTIPAVPGAISGNTTLCQNSTQTYSITPVPGATSYTWTFPTDWSYSGASTSASINAIIGSNSGLVKVKSRSACGNSADKTIQVNVGGVPAVPGVISGNASVCEPGQYTYSITPVPGATSYTWTFPPDWSYTGSSTSASIIAIVGNDSGPVKVKSRSVCGNSVDNSMQVNVVNMDNTVTVDNFELTSNATGVNYQWINCSTMQPISGATGQVFNPTQNGTYAVVINQGSCTDTSACNPFTTLGVSFNDESINLVAYPNPTRDQVLISASGLKNEKHRIVFRNTQGQILIDKEFKVNNQNLETNFDMSKFPSGLYFITISSEHLKHVLKIEKL